MQLGLASEIKRSTERLKELDEKLEKARKTLEVGTVEKTVIVSKYSVVTQDVKANAGEISAAISEYQKLGAERLALSTQLEGSNGVLLGLIKDQFGIAEREQKVTEEITETTRKRADIISEIKRTQTELNALQGKETKTETELKNIKALDEQLKGLNDEYKAFTGKEYDKKTKDSAKLLAQEKAANTKELAFLKSQEQAYGTTGIPNFIRTRGWEILLNCF